MIKNIIITVLLLALIGQKEFIYRTTKVTIEKAGYQLGWLDGIQFGLTNNWPKVETESLEERIVVSPEYLRHQENMAWELKLQEFNR